MSTYINPSSPAKLDFGDCPGAAREYLQYLLSIKGLSARTVNGYYIDLRTFFRFLYIHRGAVAADTPPDKVNVSQMPLSDIQSVTKMEIYEFLFYVTQQRENSASTRARKLSSLRGFFSYMTTKVGKMEHNPTDDVDNPKQKQRLPKYLSLAESKALLSNIDSDFYERDYCVITLFLNCGMRLSELVAINVKDVKADTLRVVGKGNKERIIYLNDACKQALSALIDARKEMENLRDEDALFVSKRTGKRLTARRIQQLVTANFQTAGLGDKGYTVHKLRHTAATLLYQHGHVDILSLKEVLGHENLSTTQIYTHLDTAELKKVAQASPLSGETARTETENMESRAVENPVESVENKGK